MFSKWHWLEISVDWNDERPIIFRKLDRQDKTVEERGYMSWEDALTDELLQDDMAFTRLFPRYRALLAICEEHGHIPEDEYGFSVCVLCATEIAGS